MSWQQSLRRFLVSQFGNPRGLVGYVVGWVMGHRSSNVERNRWVVSLLDVGPTDRILEVGFGPGVALGELARLAPRGYVCGIDRSKVMVRLARRRNAAAVNAGVLDVRVGSAEDLPDFDRPFDRVMAVNSLGFWHEPAARLRELRELLRPSGLIAIGSQPRSAGANARSSDAAASDIVALLEAAGFGELRIERLELQPPVVCVIGRA